MDHLGIRQFFFSGNCIGVRRDEADGARTERVVAGS